MVFCWYYTVGLFILFEYLLEFVCKYRDSQGFGMNKSLLLENFLSVEFLPLDYSTVGDALAMLRLMKL